MIDYLARKEILHDAFFKKYAAKKYMKASIIVREWIRSQCSAEELAFLDSEHSKEMESDDEDQENVSEDENGDDDSSGSESDDYLCANELEDHEVDE
jgi:hypothetical protein